jgi:alpha-ribazole phosphatase
MPRGEPTIIDYIRHGQPVGGSRYRGNGVDDPLSDSGWQQMRDTTSHIDGWQRVVSSPMRRCLAFADWLARERGLPITVEQDLREVGFGSWEGMVRRDLRTQRRMEYEAFYRDPVNNRPRGAEPLGAFGARVSDVFDRLLAAHPGEHVLVVAHAGVIRATLGHVTHSPAGNWYRTEVNNAAITRFAGDVHSPRLVAHNWRPAL